MSKVVGCSPSFASKTIKELEVIDSSIEADFFIKRVEIKNLLVDRFTSNAEEPLFTLRTIKRGIQEHFKVRVSKPAISGRLKATGFKYVPININFAELSKKKKYGLQKIDTRGVDLIKVALEGLVNKSWMIIFFDECKFQTSDIPKKGWRNTNKQENPTRPLFVKKTYDVLAACTLYEMVAIQVYESPIRQEDVVYFLNDLYYRLQDDLTEIIFVGDNASWHTGQKVEEARLHQIMQFNQPGLPMLNLIESYFSKAKNLYLNRSYCRTAIEDAEAIVNVFKAITKKDASGFRRSLIRTYIKALMTFKNNMESLKYDKLLKVNL